MTSKTALKPHLEPFSALSDFEVAQRVLNGDMPLFELLMRRYNRRLFLVARSILKDDALAEDVVQESYLIAFEHLAQFKGPDGFGAWLVRIGSRQAMRMLRRRSRLGLVSNEPGLADEAPAPARMEPEQIQIDREASHLLERELDRLPRDFRIIFVLRELEELSTAETAESLEITPGTVKSRLHRARSLLQLRLSRPLAAMKADAFPFAGTRCDRIVATVFERLSAKS
ncbi:RNA polymerase sigma factor [Elongatibacter sediminis]|uniref:RNA polymerase sigma factor n=1 Tax=Elongatibacter sediminis TaxID=3119006 RepID=A0AAW9RFL3_9GAMM